MLEHLGLVVHLIPAVAQFAHQEGLHEPVAAHHRERGIAPASVRVTAPYFSWSTSPWSASLRMDSEAVLADTPMRSASILVLTFSSDHSWAVQMTLR